MDHRLCQDTGRQGANVSYTLHIYSLAIHNFISTSCRSEEVYCSLKCAKSADCKAFYYESSVCYESRGSGLIAGSDGSPNSKSVWLAMGKTNAWGASVDDIRKTLWYFDPLPLVTVTNQLILFPLSAFWGPVPPTHCGHHIWKPPLHESVELINFTSYFFIMKEHQWGQKSHPRQLQRPQLQLHQQLPKVSWCVSGRTKRTNPIWIGIWFGDTKFAIFPQWYHIFVSVRTKRINLIWFCIWFGDPKYLYRSQPCSCPFGPLRKHSGLQVGAEPQWRHLQLVCHLLGRHEPRDAELFCGPHVQPGRRHLRLPCQCRLLRMCAKFKPMSNILKFSEIWKK